MWEGIYRSGVEGRVTAVKRLWVVSLVVVVVMAAMTACGGTDVVATEKDDGGSMTVKRGGALQVRLPSNPSTGYAWQVVEMPAFLSKEGDTSFEQGGPSGAVGAGGTETLRFVPTTAGAGTVKLEYRRSWETTAPAEDTFTLEVTAE